MAGNVMVAYFTLRSSGYSLALPSIVGSGATLTGFVLLFDFGWFMHFARVQYSIEDTLIYQYTSVLSSYTLSLLHVYRIFVQFFLF